MTDDTLEIETADNTAAATGDALTTPDPLDLSGGITPEFRALLGDAALKLLTSFKGELVLGSNAAYGVPEAFDDAYLYLTYLANDEHHTGGLRKAAEDSGLSSLI